MTWILNSHNYQLWAKMSMLEHLQKNLQNVCKEKSRKKENQNLLFWHQNLLGDIMTWILNSHNYQLWVKMSVLEHLEVSLTIWCLQGKVKKNEKSKFAVWLQNLLGDIMTWILNSHNYQLWAKMSMLEHLEDSLTICCLQGKVKKQEIKIFAVFIIKCYGR